MQGKTLPLNNSYLSSDVMLMGGLSILVCLAAWAFMDTGSSVNTVAQLAVGLSFICNDPHFLSSYVMLYGDYRKKIMKERRYFWAAVIVPAALILVIGIAWYKASAPLMAHVITAMYFLVGWHYVKQVFGCVIVASVQRGIFYSHSQRRLLLLNLTATWFMSWLAPHLQDQGFDYYGAQHYSLQLAPWLIYPVYAFVAMTTLAVIWMQFQRWLNTGEKPAPPAVAAFVALYVWYLPVSYHPGFGYLIPFFHSLQYLALVWHMKRNEVGARSALLEGRAMRKMWMKNFGGFFARSLVLGILAFEYVPQFFDKQGWIASTSMGPTPVLVGVLLFINIHHYFIDNVIWRSDNETVRAYLFHTAGLKMTSGETTNAA